MKEFICKICGKEFDKYISICKHNSRKHKIGPEETYIEYLLNGVAPVCECGCGEKTHYSYELKGFCKFILGHAARVHNNWGNNPNFKELKQKSADTQRKLYQEGKLTIWNKGLTIEDERVKNNIEKVLASPDRGKKISEKLKGKKTSEETKQKLRESQIISWSNPEKRERQSHKRMLYIMKNGFTVKSKLEETFINILYENFNMVEHEHFIRQYYVREIKGLFDFKIANKKIFIEVDGDYWHCNPNSKFATPKYEAQKGNLIQDKCKEEWCLKNDFTLLRFWESDINNNPEIIIAKLKEYL